MFKIIIFFFFLLNYVFSQQILYTLKKTGQYVPILNERGGITQNYKGGIWIARHNGQVTNIHKTVQRGHFNPRARVNNAIPPGPPPSGQLELLYTRKKNGDWLKRCDW